MIVLANAKINLALNITGKLPGGYHSVDMIMQSVSLADEVSVCVSEGNGINIVTNSPEIPVDESNTAYMAASIFLEKLGLNRAVDINIRKNIPSRAGIAGGSADAAAVFVALNALCGNAFSTEELCKIAGKVGADVPFCILGGTCRAVGTGTELEKLDDMPDCSILVCKPDISVSTPVAYKLCDGFGFDVDCLNTDRIIGGLSKRDLAEITSNLYNKFEEVLNLSEVQEIKDTMLLYGAMGTLMSGSGPTVYGIFDLSDQASLEMCRAKLMENYGIVYATSPSKQGCILIRE